MAGQIESGPLASAYDSPTFGEDSSFHIDQAVGSMSISPCGRDVVLASKEGLHVIDLDNPYSPPRYLPHRTAWEVADVQWSPFSARDSWVASTSNQKALVWNLAMRTSQNSIEHVLHAHSRAITDINFSAHHPDLLATCAVDSFVHCWDLRTPARPVVSFSDWFTGATQVKWNRQDPHVIASSHDKSLHIWDDRKGAYPLRTFEAHGTKIYGIDWNRTRPEAIVTCALDKTIKFWNYSKEGNRPENVTYTPFPVWRTRHTPFGWGVLAMPQRGNSDLHLYSCVSAENDRSEHDDLPLVHSFPGHKGQVKEFLWRQRGGITDGMDQREFQLVSWGTDKELRLHRVDPEILKGVGYEKGKPFNPLLNLTRKGAAYKTFHDEHSYEHGEVGEDYGERSEYLAANNTLKGMSGVSMPYSRGWGQVRPIGQSSSVRGRTTLRADMNPISWMRGVKISGWEVETLGDEIIHVGEKFTRVAFESVNVGQRKATISMHGPWGSENSNVFLKIDIKFPTEYPRMEAPIFNVQRTTAVTSQLVKTVTTGMQAIAETYLSRQRGCLEGVIRYLLGEHTVEESVALAKNQPSEHLKSADILAGNESSDEDEDVGQFQDSDLALSSSELLRPINANVMVPVARACGALWANDGQLVCFFPKKEEKPPSFLDSISLRAMAGSSRNDKVFEGFGRLQTGSPVPRATAESAVSGGLITEDGGSEFSDDSSYDSSSSSGSSDLLGSLPQQFQGNHAWRHGNIGFHLARSIAGNSQRSVAGPSTARSSTDSCQNYVHIYHFNDILPAKRDLAQQYKIFGNRAEICSHNMVVAANAGLSDLSYIWGLLNLLLDNKQTTDTKGVKDGLRHILNNPVGSLRRKDSGVGLNSERQKTWGSHPLGARWFIPALFGHFEQLGDVQMLGMLSCVLYETDMKRLLPDDPSKSRASEFLDDKSFSDQQFRGKHNTTPLASKDLPNISASHSSGCSSADQWHGNTPPLYSTGTTPPTGVRGARSSMERKSRYNTSLSGSPDPPSNMRVNTNFGNTLASSLSRSLTFGPSASSSPPAGLIKKQPSPIGSLTNHGPSIWSSVGGLRSKAASALPSYLTPSAIGTPLTFSDSEESDKPVSPSANKFRRGIKVVKKHQAAFDNDCRAEVPLLDPRLQSLYQAYRENYAHLLFIWNMPIQGTEVLKMASIVDNETERSLLYKLNNKYPRTKHINRRHSLAVNHHRSTEILAEGLNLQHHCAKCGSALQGSSSTRNPLGEAIGRNSRRNALVNVQCLNCNLSLPGSQNMSCAICTEVIQGMFSPCFACGHMCCFKCHSQWFAPSSAAEGTVEKSVSILCPTGCGCICSEHLVIDMPIPPTPASPAISAATPPPAPPFSEAALSPSKSKSKPLYPGANGNRKNAKKWRNSLNQTTATNDVGQSDKNQTGTSSGIRSRASLDEQFPGINTRKPAANSGSISRVAGWIGKSSLERMDTV
ncbi:RWD, RING finger and WD repeat-containing protein [Trichophyton mentagrophytes]|uniref:RING-type domain-containing protein n=1 Tax=Trichophyton interdigitale (strain MR816) TaxID=1215338 RepID=A0A059J5R8_TRIIM|nr:hypothetical protein H101_02999 [Trichophyton interdigitale H6]KDB22842.1 hypothetical protein H109_05257 [Trichophyton interdigitale MR816]GBF62596.1 RWD, RING finger and WD repeat-containing protein [Trichophyton mentagrophytes]